MGAFLDTVSVRSGDAAAIKELIVRWMRAKGYEQRLEAPLFPLREWGALNEEGRDERGVFLVCNGQWTVALYSHMLTEGDRLIFEMGRLPAPVLRTWVHDSDLWGYKLHKDGEVLAEFNSEPRYFGEADGPSGSQDGDPTLVCAVCGLGGLEEELATLQRGRALFIEGFCRRFCALIGASPAGFGYNDLADSALDQAEPVTLGAFRVEHLYFARRGEPPVAPPDLHGVPIRTSEEEVTLPQEPSATERMHLQAMQFYVRLIVLLLWPLVLLLRWIFWLRRQLRGRALFGRQREASLDPFTQGLLTTRQAAERLEGRTLINERHHCQITLPEGVEPYPLRRPTGVFHYSIQGQMSFCEAVPPERIEEHLWLRPGFTQLEDECFFLGPLPARRLVRQWGNPNSPSVQCVYVVQGPRAFYSFWLGGTEPPSTEVLALFRELVHSFTLAPRGS
jgi:hypothetical protein